jgi:hypothetical protein
MDVRFQHYALWTLQLGTVKVMKDFLLSQRGSDLYGIGRSHVEEHAQIFSKLFIELFRLKVAITAHDMV